MGDGDLCGDTAYADGQGIPRMHWGQRGYGHRYGREGQKVRNVIALVVEFGCSAAEISGRGN